MGALAVGLPFFMEIQSHSWVFYLYLGDQGEKASSPSNAFVCYQPTHGSGLLVGELALLLLVLW